MCKNMAALTATNAFWIIFFICVAKCAGVTTGSDPTSPCQSPSHDSIGRPSNCLELQLIGYTTSGIYTIYPRLWYNVPPFKVYCDMKTDGGGWTVFQRRAPAEFHINFTQSWKEYKQGFGDLKEEFWLGNDFLYVLTNQDQVTLRIDLEASEGNSTYATYGKFQVGPAKTDYNISVGEFVGETDTVPGDSFSRVNGWTFVTYDKNDVNNCSKMYKGGWWYTKCHASNLNGLYLAGDHKSYAVGIDWKSWTGYHYSLMKTEMKIRPRFPYD